MTFMLAKEEATTEGPYCLGAPRPLSPLEIAYTELMVQVELDRAEAELAAAMAVGEAGSGPVAMGRRPHTSLPQGALPATSEQVLAPAASLGRGV